MIALEELAGRLECRFEGDPGTPVRGIAPLATAETGDLSFLTDLRYREQARQTRASVLLVSDEFPAFERQPSLAWLRSPEPEVAAARAIELLRPAWRPPPGVHPTAAIDPSARLGPRAHVGAFVVIGAGCELGADAVLHPHAVLYPDVRAGERLTLHAHAVVREGSRLGDDVVLQPGAVVGGDGFGFARRRDGSYAKIPQVGTVQLGDQVEIQSNACVDRGSLTPTRLGRGVKVDNLVQVAHNCEVADDVILCSQTGLAGSTRIDRGAILAGQVGVAGHCHIGAGAIITAQSGTHGDLEAGRMYSGSPAFDHGQWLRATAAFARLGELQREVRQLKQEVRQLRSGQ